MRGIAALVIVAAGASLAPAQVTFEFLPSSFGAQRALARGVSGDGQVIAGSSAFFTTEMPVAWRKVAGAWQRLDLPAEGAQGLGRAVSLSHDGDVIGGMTNIFTGPSGVYGTAAVWRGVRSGVPVIETPMDTPSVRRGIFSGISDDGAVIAGYASDVPSTAVREIWSYGTGGLSRLSPPGSPSSYATPYMFGNVVSGDGSVIVGSRLDVERRIALRWTAAGGFVELPTPSTGSFRHSMAEAVSRDGAVVGGCLTFSPMVYNGEASPALWTSAGRIDLPVSPPLGLHGRVLALSGDGSIAGGVVYFGTLILDGSSHAGESAALWIDGQMHGLAAYLTARGINMAGIQPHWVTGISQDGRTLVGFASQQGQGLKSFVVTLPPPCRADLNGDGLADFTDYLIFLNHYEAQNPAADFTGDGLVDFTDYLEFLNEYESGC